MPGDSSEEPGVIGHRESRGTYDGPDPAVHLRFHHLDPDETISYLANVRKVRVQCTGISATSAHRSVTYLPNMRHHDRHGTADQTRSDTR